MLFAPRQAARAGAIFRESLKPRFPPGTGRRERLQPNPFPRSGTPGKKIQRAGIPDLHPIGFPKYPAGAREKEEESPMKGNARLNHRGQGRSAPRFCCVQGRGGGLE